MCSIRKYWLPSWKVNQVNKIKKGFFVIVLISLDGIKCFLNVLILSELYFFVYITFYNNSYFLMYQHNIYTLIFWYFFLSFFVQLLCYMLKRGKLCLLRKNVNHVNHTTKYFSLYWISWKKNIIFNVSLLLTIFVIFEKEYIYIIKFLWIQNIENDFRKFEWIFFFLYIVLIDFFFQV